MPLLLQTSLFYLLRKHQITNMLSSGKCSVKLPRMLNTHRSLNHKIISEGDLDGGADKNVSIRHIRKPLIVPPAITSLICVRSNVRTMRLQSRPKYNKVYPPL